MRCACASASAARRSASPASRCRSSCLLRCSRDISSSSLAMARHGRCSSSLAAWPCSCRDTRQLCGRCWALIGGSRSGAGAGGGQGGDASALAVSGLPGTGSSGEACARLALSACCSNCHQAGSPLASRPSSADPLWCTDPSMTFPHRPCAFSEASLGIGGSRERVCRGLGTGGGRPKTTGPRLAPAWKPPQAAAASSSSSSPGRCNSRRSCASISFRRWYSLECPLKKGSSSDSRTSAGELRAAWRARWPLQRSGSTVRTCGEPEACEEAEGEAAWYIRAGGGGEGQGGGSSTLGSMPAVPRVCSLREP
mmetsp:Transcript_29699/g.94638  ORF Transcript_29699/g.94638 Transcript_29699/m.94638 type:complete len:310 (-) Transcript_29699:1-930(-)